MKRLELLEKAQTFKEKKFKFSCDERKKEVLDFFTLPVKINVDLHWNDFQNEYEIYSGVDIPFFLIHIICEYSCLGSEAADCETDRWIFSSTEWTSEELIMQHWEDGKFKFQYFSTLTNRALYLLNAPKPRNTICFRDFEYNDFDCRMPEENEYIIQV